MLVVVEDHGVGVSSEIQSTLFRPFKQAQRLTGGTGLGLFSLYKRIEALGGKCGCTSRSDGDPEGSMFWFTFPYRNDLAVMSSTLSKDFSRDNSFNARLVSDMPPLSCRFPHGAVCSERDQEQDEEDNKELLLMMGRQGSLLSEGRNGQLLSEGSHASSGLSAVSEVQGLASQGQGLVPGTGLGQGQGLVQ